MENESPMLTHISQIEWSNEILYGGYKFNKGLVRRKLLSEHVREIGMEPLLRIDRDRFCPHTPYKEKVERLK